MALLHLLDVILLSVDVWEAQLLEGYFLKGLTNYLLRLSPKRLSK